MLANDESLASPGASPGRWKRALNLEWLGQTIASLAWIVSVFSYGISSGGDWLQLLAAASWFIANLGALVSDRTGERDS